MLSCANFVVLLARLGLLLALPTLAFPIWRPSSNNNQNQNRKEIVIKRIKKPCLGIRDSIDDLRLSLGETGLCFDCSAVNNGRSYYGSESFYYLATWKDDPRIIGMIEISPDWEDVKTKNEDGFKELRILKGLELDLVHTASQYRRMGVGSALFKAIERDAVELMEIMVTFLNNRNKPFSIHRRLDGRIQLRLYPRNTREALSFYQSMGFRWEPRQGEGDYGRSLFKKLTTRLKLIWLCFIKGDLYALSSLSSSYEDLVKIVKPDPNHPFATKLIREKKEL